VVSAAPEALFRAAIPGGFSFRRLRCDVGVVQKDALSLDETGTWEAWRAFARDMSDLADAEWRYLHHVGARVVLGDIPPLAFQAAHEAGVPSLALGNFSWDWIYRHLGERQVKLRDAAERCADSYSRAGLLLRLPFAGDMRAFPRIEDIPLVARTPRLKRADARRALGLGAETTLLLSFGGIGLPDFDASVLAGLRHFVFLGTERPKNAPPNFRLLDMAALAAQNVHYEDVVGAVDVVVSKPGYGIVSDAIGAGVRLIYTDRGDFPEYGVLVKEMQDWLACAYVSQGDLRAGRLAEPLREVLAKTPPPAPDTSGADVAAWRLLETVARGA
jgi:L-arabinokinase